MSSPDGRLWITYNGEIYNFLELQAELEALGHEFRTTCDTEVLLTAYAHWGAERCTASTACSRSPSGIGSARSCSAPATGSASSRFYYTVVDGRFRFASEIKALFVTRLCRAERMTRA